MIKGLHHNAYRCRDSAETRRFYEDFLGLPLAEAFEIRTTKTGRDANVLHTFYRLGDGSFLAFFEAPEQPFEFKSQHDFDLHIALEVDRETLNAMSRILQTRGWYASTLSELRNRADLVLMVGVNLAERYENLVRRCLRPATTLHEDTLSARHIVLLGGQTPAALLPGCETIKCRNEDLTAVLAALLALGRDQPVQARKVGTVAATTLAFLGSSDLEVGIVRDQVCASCMYRFRDLSRERA